MRQIYSGSQVYAGDFFDWLPVFYDPQHDSLAPPNYIQGTFYTRYVVGTESPPANTPVPPNYYFFNSQTPPLSYFQSLGLLYAGHYLGGGQVMWCPSFLPSSPLAIENYSVPKFMSTCNAGTDPQSGNTVVRSTYLWNPVVQNPSNDVKYVSTLRAYQKTKDLPGRKLLMIDWLEGGMTWNNLNFAHYPSKGWVVLTTDGSARFIYSYSAFTNATKGDFSANEESEIAFEGYNAVYNDLLAVP